ncbi:isoprenylcysteine carboxylmethyltransferase family protein [Vicingaceae bacterium]|nr:isoprenylcysteine carboxylmethyltransferase family protein [Vicingaceae bacterium]MDB4061862.1 isoprenylcysteine carboxylmethyltransferase family protein [Vicingaceae bacterium]MDB9963466.1 isoprenylcysteine carboxylmethyltransferase family protein [Vicingaceae bacterium]MDC1451660.1 isoprenylcysteine carboxylmethyltransferase family protein [Vicingaceae bacterium]
MALFQELEKQGVKLFKYRGTLPIFILVAALALYAYQCYSPSFTGVEQYFPSEGNIYQIICLVVSLIGLFIRIHTLGFVIPNTSGRNTQEQIADGINKSGMYSLLRHPLYLGNFLMWLGIGMLTENIWFNIIFILSFWLYYERIMYAEETFLINKFGDEYTKWSKDVPPFIPRLSNYEKPALDFAWRKVIRQEKSGIAALFIVFMLFHQVECYFNEATLDFTMSLWNLLFIIFTTYIIVVKLIQKTTDWLDIEKTR